MKRTAEDLRSLGSVVRLTDFPRYYSTIPSTEEAVSKLSFTAPKARSLKGFQVIAFGVKSCLGLLQLTPLVLRLRVLTQPLKRWAILSRPLRGRNQR